MTNWPDVSTKAAEGISYFTPAQSPPAGIARHPQTSGKPTPSLFKPLTIRGQTFQTRLGLAPMCQYRADDGHITPWHLAHYGGIAQLGPGIIIIEATGVVPEGRITTHCVGLWKDSQIAPMRQLAHAGRKASTVPPSPWLGEVTATNAVGGLGGYVKAPSSIPIAEGDIIPKSMIKEDIHEFKDAWVAATKRDLSAGVYFVKIHNAHGYLLSSFLSSPSNKRKNEYGGSFENRTRLSWEIAQLTRITVGPNVPVFLRVSAADWLENSMPDEKGWKLEDTLEFAGTLAAQGCVYLIDISTGGVHSAQKITAGPTFQAPFAAAVKKAVGDRMLVTALGMINHGNLAEKILNEDGTDVILVGRGFQRDTGLAWQFAKDLGVEIAMAGQIRREIHQFPQCIRIYPA